MKLKIEVEMDTEKQNDLELVEDLFFQLQDIKEILEERQKNLNKRNNKTKARFEHGWKMEHKRKNC